MITTTYSSLGELIRYHRKQSVMTLTKLSKLTNIDKANLSRIESGQIRRPTLVTIQKIRCILNIPYEEMINKYVEIEERVEVLFNILDKLLERKNLSIITKVSKKILQSPTEDTVDLVKKLYGRVENIEESSIKLTLYQLIVNYSRAYGIMEYFTKCLLQAYLIERDDFSKLRSTYSSGKNIIEFDEFLTSEEKGVMYYKLSVHAYNLCLFKESVEMGEKAMGASIFDIRIQANTIQATCNSYYYLSNYEQARKYLDQYKEFSLPEVKDNVNVLEAMLHSANGNYQMAISLLKKNIPSCGNNALLHAVNELIKIYLQTHDLSEITELIELEDKFLSIPYVTPFKKAELALYYKLKGDYFLLTGRVEEGVDCYLEAASRYSKIDLTTKESECLRQIMNIQTNKHDIIISIHNKLGIYYDEKVRKG
ncbi:helix-turn-helix domain-containing protein [Chengkuizengella sp. SCS-71B]|uniref:helix-turn-helix domain-containing protein n=1 Tax=Chengkuizengella sp. SCS-71B TaxID=3115290 RepID=UPI0032C20E58